MLAAKLSYLSVADILKVIRQKPKSVLVSFLVLSSEIHLTCIHLQYYRTSCAEKETDTHRYFVTAANEPSPSWLWIYCTML